MYGHKMRASRHNSVDVATILEDDDPGGCRGHDRHQFAHTLRPRGHTRHLPTLPNVVIVAVLLLLLCWWLGPPRTPLRAVLSVAARLAQSSPSQQPIMTHESLQALPLRVVLKNATGDVEVLASLLGLFFSRQADPTLELQFKLFVQEQATRCGACVVCCVGLYKYMYECGRRHANLEWGLDWLNGALRVLLPIWLLSVLWRPRHAVPPVAQRVAPVFERRSEQPQPRVRHVDKTDWRAFE